MFTLNFIEIPKTSIYTTKHTQINKLNFRNAFSPNPSISEQMDIRTLVTCLVCVFVILPPFLLTIFIVCGHSLV